MQSDGACSLLEYYISSSASGRVVWRILRSDWLRERARWSDTARPGLPFSFPHIKFRQSSSPFLRFLCLCGTKKNENNENKNVDEFGRGDNLHEDSHQKSWIYRGASLF